MAAQPSPRAMTKVAIYRELATATGLTREQVVRFFEKLVRLIKRELSKKGPGAFTLPGLIKLRTMRKRAVRAHKGIHPITKQPMLWRAKPARVRAKARALKKLNDLLN